MVITVLLADDHGVIRDGLRCLLEAETDLRVVGTARNGQEAVREAKRLAPQVLLMDVAMPVMGGIDAARAVHEARPDIGVIFLSVQDGSSVVHRALEAGARGYLSKECSAAELLKAIRAVAAGKRYFGKGIAERVFDRLGATVRQGVDSLNARERELVRLVTEGKSNAQVAGLLELSPRTVETYRIRIMRKLELDNLAALVKFAVRNGITTLD
ncbi:MAG TPA: response regulator transcription factor [Burkholderiales bacterium]|jgi:DNA-binding NarL/FixJ family response regulator|nr:response regulator transcription factor [Burkholderiales bacterium]